MEWSIGKKIGGGFLLSVMVIVFIGIVGYINIEDLIEHNEAEHNTREIIAGFEHVYSEIKGAESGALGHIITNDDNYLTLYSSGKESIKEELEDIDNLISGNAALSRKLSDLDNLITEELIIVNKWINKMDEEGFEAAVVTVGVGTGLSVMTNIKKLVDEVIAEQTALLSTRVIESHDAARKANITIIVGILTAIVLLSFAGFIITRNITVPLSEVTSVSEKISIGDLNVNVQNNGRADEVGVLMNSFSKMVLSLKKMADIAERIAGGDLSVKIEPESEKDILGSALENMVHKLRELTTEILNSVDELSKSTSETSISVTQLSTSVSETATSISETTATVKEVVQAAELSSQKAGEVSENAKGTIQISETGIKVTEETIEGMKRVQEQMLFIGESIMKLSEQSQAIGEIIASVDDISDQSSLLAVNASIEAAKAEEHGKGFTIVAQELKSLSEQSKKATARVRGILTEIQKATSVAVMATEQGTKIVEAGVIQSGQAGNSIEVLAGSVDGAANAMIQISASSQQQMIGMQQVATAVDSINQASNQNAASVKQLEITANNLSDLGSRLKQLAGKFSV